MWEARSQTYCSTMKILVEHFRAKTPSTPEDQSEGVAIGVQLICEKAGIKASDISLVLHGTTVATNAVLEGKGARVGLLVDERF